MRLKKNLLALSASLLIVAGGFMSMEPVIDTAQAVTDTVVVNQSVTSEITISSPTDITLTALSTTQNTAVGAVDWTVVTNNSAGYSLTLYAGASPAMVRSGGGGNIADYTPAVAETPETWNTSSSTVEFGFSARGTNVNTSTYGTDSDCIDGADVPSAGLKWRDFDTSGSADEIATTASPTTTAGATSQMCVATEQDTTFAVSGTYAATITATATAL